MVGQLGASGCVNDGALDGTGGIGLATGVPEEILQSQGTPHQNMASIAGSQLCEDVTNAELYIADRGDSGSSWIRLTSGT